MITVKHVSALVYRGAQPKTEEDLKHLWNIGIRTIINLQEGWKVWKGEREAWEKLGGKFIHYGFSNFFPPSFDETRSVLEDIDLAVKNGNVFIHCLAGVDRTGWISGAYLVDTQFNTIDEAWTYIRQTGMHWWYVKLLWKKKAFTEVCNKILRS